MATLAQIMRVRKIALKNIYSRMRVIDTIQETIERYIKRLVARRNKLPNVNEMQRIIRSMATLDGAEGKLIEACNTAIKVFEQSADLASDQLGRIQGITPKDLTQLGKDMARFLSDLAQELPTYNIGVGGQR